jgi:glycine betaine/proline transport system permease protein
MSTAVLAGAAPRHITSVLAWAVLFGFFLLIWIVGPTVLPWAFDIPADYRIPAQRWIGGFMNWLVNDAGVGLFSFQDATRFLAALVDIPYRFLLSLVSTGFTVGQGASARTIVPAIPWFGVVLLASLWGHWAGGMRIALVMACCFGFLAVFGQWASAMVTLASILVAVPLGAAGGLLFGIAAWRHPWFERALRPVLDLMQTIPVFAYLVPILFLFGFGPTAAVVATLIYAMPPMIRITILALQGVASEIHDLARMSGCTRRQEMWRVLVPSARESLMVGVNQVIMLSLNMVIIASMIGAGGLGFDVLAALRRLDIGAGIESGLAIVVLAIALDRLSQAFAASASASTSDRQVRGTGLIARHPYLAASLVVLVASLAIAILAPSASAYPESLRLSTGAAAATLVQWINVNYFDLLEAAKNAVLLNVLVPVKRFLLGLPWLGVCAALGFAGYRLGGMKLALLASGLSFLIAATGQWEKAVITVYLCGISVAVALLLGVPLGIVAADRRELWRWLRAAIDTLQTLPSFVFLMPAVMLFRVGDFTAMLAVVAFAIVPAIRYTVLGLEKVDPYVVEAGRAMGCTSLQSLMKIRLKLALPEILLGVNQTVMFALAMLVITALVGTRDLGQEVYIALTKADTGRGIVAGLAVAFIAIVADRMITAGAERLRRRMGMA